MVLASAGCRPASYGKDVVVVVPSDTPSDGPEAEPPGPRARVLYPAYEIQVMVPADQIMPRGIKRKTSEQE